MRTRNSGGNAMVSGFCGALAGDPKTRESLPERTRTRLGLAEVQTNQANIYHGWFIGSSLIRVRNTADVIYLADGTKGSQCRQCCGASVCRVSMEEEQQVVAKTRV